MQAAFARARAVSMHGSSQITRANFFRVRELNTGAVHPMLLAQRREAQRKPKTTIFAVFLSTGQIGEFVPATNATRCTPSTP